jgi:hypothetical protein
MGSKHKKKKHRRQDSSSPEDRRSRNSDRDRRDEPSSSSSHRSHHRSEHKRSRSTAPDEYEQPPKYVKKDSDDDEETDFAFEKYKYELNMIFFRDGDLVKQGSDEYKDFWSFLKNFVANQKRMGKQQFDRSKLMAVGLKAKTDELMARMPPRDRSTGRWLSKKRIEEFKGIFLMYLDFKQKEKFKKLKALRDNQSTLPVYHYK